MDINDVRDAVSICGMTEEEHKRIWKAKEDTEFVERYIKYKQQQEAANAI